MIARLVVRGHGCIVQHIPTTFSPCWRPGSDWRCKQVTVHPVPLPCTGRNSKAFLLPSSSDYRLSRQDCKSLSITWFIRAVTQGAGMLSRPAYTGYLNNNILSLAPVQLAPGLWNRRVECKLSHVRAIIQRAVNA